MPATDDSSPTWDGLVVLEPALRVLEDDIRAIEAGPRFCANQVWYRTFRPRLVMLVGHTRGVQRRPASKEGSAPRPWSDIRDDPEVKSQEHAVNRRRRRETREGRGALWSSEAYDVAYDLLYALLPDCRTDCACQRVRDALPRGHLHA